MRHGSVTLGDLVDRLAMLDVACSRCARRGRLQLDRLIEQYGDAELPELRLTLAGDCPKREAVSIGERCGTATRRRPSRNWAAPIAVPLLRSSPAKEARAVTDQVDTSRKGFSDRC